MLLEYEVANYRSFRGAAYIDLRAPRSRVLKRYPNNYVPLSAGGGGLKESVIVGENAGGKSNFVESLDFLRDLLVRADVPAKSQARRVNSGTSTGEQSFGVVLELNGERYAYELTIDYVGIVSEKLAHGKTENVVYRLARLPIADGKVPYDIELGLRRGDVDPESLNRSLGLGTSRAFKRPCLASLAALGEPHARRVLNWFVNDLRVTSGGEAAAIDQAYASGDLQRVMAGEKYRDIVRLADRSVINLEIDEERPFEESVVIRRDREGREYRRLVRDDSAGVRQFLRWAYFVYEVVYEGKTVFADEVDSAINPILSDRVLSFINGSATRGQFVFTTHNIFNLTLRTFMKEQINFVTRDPETLVSTLYSCADFPEIRYDVKQELYEFYMKGLLGGVVDA